MRKTPAWSVYGRCFAALWLLTLSSTSLARAELAATELAPQFSGIRLEKSCFGCADGVRVVLQREGLATRTVLGQARLGTVDQSQSSPLSREDFETLLRFILEQGFLDLLEVYEDADLRDGSWTQITLSGNGREKTVFQRESAGPAALQAMVAAIQDLAGQLFKTTH